MKYSIILDENIENARQTFEKLGRIILMQGREIDNNSVKEADFLFVRSITSVNRELLKESKIKFVGTATIGTDHIDIEYLKSSGIGFTSAKGCNSDAVAEYVFMTVFYVAVRKGISLEGKSIGIIGCGNIGSRVEEIAKAFGFKTVVNDPPLARETGGSKFKSLVEALQCDIVTFHTPLIREGIDKTFHLINENNLKLLKPGAILINASRGEVIDNEALDKYLDENNLSVILDVWENEPDFSVSLLRKTLVASPHVAGYSLEGKINGTKIVYDALCNFMEFQKEWSPELPIIDDNIIEFKELQSFEKTVERILTHEYDPEIDIGNMWSYSEFEDGERGKGFDDLRKTYCLRREFSNYIIKGDIRDSRIKEGLKALRFKFEE
jgi:erythronate-4-phosphate dehydrogenase